MSGIAYPKVNGRIPQYSDAEITLGEFGKFKGIREINWEDDLEREDIHANAAEKLGTTRGTQNANGSMTMLHEDFYALVDAIGDGYKEVPFDITVAFQWEEGGKVNSARLIGAKIGKVSEGGSNGADALTVDVDLNILRVERNGKRALKNMLA